MSDQKENQSLIESFEEDSSGLWVPNGPIITHRSLSTRPCTPPQADVKQPVTVQVDEEIFFTNNPVNKTVIENDYVEDTNLNRNDESDNNTLNYSYSLLDGQPNKTIPSPPESGRINSSHGDLSKSLFSETQSPLRNKAHSSIVDRFNGILYHEHHFNEKISIVFSSDDLYNGFITAINKELHAKKISEVRSNYTTHVRGKGCTLITDSEHCSVSASGQGSKLWREIVFSRMAIHLYKQFTKDIDSEINIASSQSFSMTSTPGTSMTTKVQSSPNVTPVTIKPGTQQRIVHNKLSLSELNSHVAELTEISKNLQNQLILVNAKIDTLIQRSTQCSQPTRSGNLSISEISDDSFITLSETNESEDSKLFPGSRTYSSAVVNGPEKSKPNSNKVVMTDKHVLTCEAIKNNKQNSRTPEKSIPSQTSKENKQPTGRTLLIGDSVLSGINKKGLRKGVECKSVSGATIDTILDTIEIFDISKFHNIVVYVGGNDVSGETEIAHFEQQYENLISLIRKKNSKCKVLLSNMCPRGDIDVTEINDVIRDLCQTHNVTLINSNADFYDKKKKLRNHFYKLWDSIHLSRSGTKRLLGSFERHISIVENFETCVYLPRTLLWQETPLDNPPSSHINHYRTRNKHHYNYNNNFQSTGNGTSDSGLQARCLKCGMTNHETYNCRHKTQVKCHKCNLYGHKDSTGLCYNI